MKNLIRVRLKGEDPYRLEDKYNLEFVGEIKDECAYYLCNRIPKINDYNVEFISHVGRGR